MAILMPNDPLVRSQAREGKVHDRRQLDEEKLVDCVPGEVPIHLDLGFQGLQKEFVNIKIPSKKPRGRQLTTSWSSVLRRLTAEYR
jgi:hypothetical protein